MHDPVIAHNGFDIKYLLERNPDVIYMPPRYYTGIRSEILQSKLFHEKYTYYPYLTSAGLAISVNSKSREYIENSIKDNFELINSSCIRSTN